MTMPAQAARPAVRTPSPRQRRRRRARRVTRVLLVGVLALLVGAGTFVGGLLAAPIDFAVPPPPTSAILLAADGSQLAVLAPPQRREIVPATDIPDAMRHAMISAEDERFLQHSGVDLLAVARAAYSDVTGGSTQGGSTLTQQYVKNVYVRNNDRTALRKIREAALAVRLEQRKSNQEILTDYLNVLYLGNGNYGVQAAAKFYFGVPVKDLALDPATGQRSAALELARASMLAGIAPAPSFWNPVKDLSMARKRQSYTLNRMITNGYASSVGASEALRQDIMPVEAGPAEAPNTIAPEFVDLVKSQLRTKFASRDREDLLFQSGLQVTTTLDLDLQTAVTRALHEVLPDSTDPQAAVVAVDTRTGDVKALATLRRAPAVVKVSDGSVVTPAVTGYGRGPGQSEFNLAYNARRSTGSTIKPFTLAVALQQGHNLDEQRFAPDSQCLPNKGGAPDPYCYGNAERSGGRTETLRSALYNSVNTVFVPLAIEVGRSKVKALMMDEGVQADANQFAVGPPSFGLGTTAEVSPVSMANAYSMFVTGGLVAPSRTVSEITTDPAGTGQHSALPGEVPVVTARRVLAEPVADGVADAMSQVVVRGTAPRAQQDFPVYGKTGTTNDSKDVWFVGCAKAPQNLCISTWMGYDFKECTGSVTNTVDGKAVITKTRVDGPCGGMHDLHGFHDVYGGTLPAQVFARTFAILTQIQQDRAAALAAAAAAAAARARAPDVSAAPTSQATVPSVSAAPSRSAPSAPSAAASPTAAPRASATPRGSSATPSPSPAGRRPPTLLPSPGSTQPPDPPPSPAAGAPAALAAGRAGSAPPGLARWSPIAHPEGPDS